MEAEDAIVPLRAGDLDITIAEEYADVPRPRQPTIDRVPIGTDRIVLALPAGHPLAVDGGRPVRLARLAGEFWCATRPYTSFHDLLVSTCRTAGFEPDIRHHANDVALLAELVADGHGVALLPSLGRPELHPGLAVRRLAGLTIDRTIFAAMRHGAAARPSIAVTLTALQQRASDIGL
jgi:DNA-binding transcriptional LysR family regulator